MTPDLNEVVAIARQICAGLDYAAEKGVYHHFLNVYNIKVLPGNEVKILDFGLIHDKNLLSQTGTKKLDNEPYLSPEQVKNKIPDRASNMFSLATIVYELFTTRNPFAGKHLGEVDRAIGDAMPHPLNVANGRVPEAVSRVVLKAMSKNPADRHASGAQFMAELDQAMREPRMPSKSATGVFPAVGNTTGSFKAVGNTTSKIPASPVTTRSNVPVPATTSAAVRKPVSGPSNQWKIVGGIVAAVVILAALAMVFQRKPADTTDADTSAVATPATSNASEPVTQQTATVAATERSDSGQLHLLLAADSAREEKPRSS